MNSHPMHWRILLLMMIEETMEAFHVFHYPGCCWLFFILKGDEWYSVQHRILCAHANSHQTVFASLDFFV